MLTGLRGVCGEVELAPLVRELGWSHNRIVLEKCKDGLERVRRLRMTRRFGWSKNVLMHQVENRAHVAADGRRLSGSWRTQPDRRGRAAYSSSPSNRVGPS